MCGKKFSNESATVLCQELGFRGAYSWSTGLLWEVQSSYDVALSEVMCPPNAVSFKECLYNTEIDHSADEISCDHNHDVFLSCISNNGWLEVSYIGFRNLSSLIDQEIGGLVCIYTAFRHLERFCIIV